MTDRALQHVGAAERELALVESPADAKALYDKLETLSQYAKRVKADTDKQNEIARVKLLTARKGGALLSATIKPGKSSRDGRNTNLPEGMTWNMSSRWQALAKKYTEPELADEIDRLRVAADDAITLGLFLNMLGGTKTSEHVQWYTPADYIEAARDVLGGIDLDPASSALANETVKAVEYFDELDDGLTQTWRGRVWLNPPYGKGSGLFTTKLVDEHSAGNVTAAILLLNAYGFDSGWFQPLWDHPICFTDHRIVFTSPDRTTGGPANANIFIYLGPDEAQFVERFSGFGAVVRRVA